MLYQATGKACLTICILLLSLRLKLFRLIDCAEYFISLSKELADAIRLLREAQPDMLIGAGTVLNREQVILAKQAGGTFIVSPGFNPNTVKSCQELDIAIVPGVNNLSQRSLFRHFLSRTRQ